MLALNFRERIFASHHCFQNSRSPLLPIATRRRIQENGFLFGHMVLQSILFAVQCEFVPHRHQYHIQIWHGETRMAQPGSDDSILPHLFAAVLEIHVVSATKTRNAKRRKYFVGWI